MTYVLTTNRLGLREMGSSDLDFIAEMLRHPEVMRYYPKLYSRAEAKEWLSRQQRRYRQQGHGLWLVEDRLTHANIGQVGVSLQRVGDRELPEIGYLIHRPFWRQGFAIEAASAVRDHSFNNLNMSEVFSLIRPANTPSQAVAKRLGMLPKAEVLFHDLPHLLFSVTKPEQNAA